MAVYVYDVSAAELAQVEGGLSFSWGLGSPDCMIRLRRVVS
jgi:hypothetical protein